MKLTEFDKKEIDNQINNFNMDIKTKNSNRDVLRYLFWIGNNLKTYGYKDDKIKQISSSEFLKIKLSLNRLKTAQNIINKYCHNKSISNSLV